MGLVIMISSGPKWWAASFKASTQKSASSVFEMCQASTLRVEINTHLHGAQVERGDRFYAYRNGTCHGEGTRIDTGELNNSLLSVVIAIFFAQTPAMG